MLTWENFQNSWGTTKEQDAGKRNEKGKGKRWQEEEAEEMVVDEPVMFGNGETGTARVQMEVGRADEKRVG